MKFHAESNIGKVRPVNEDSYSVVEFDDGVLIVVCDGVGGENAGEIASRMTCDEISSNFKASFRDEMDINSVKNLLLSSVTRANVIVHETSKSQPKYSGMGTTVVAAFLRGDVLQVAHAGDSRAYVTSSTGIKLVTADHTVARMLFEQGKIDSEAMDSIPEKNIITRAVGIHKEIDVDYNEEYLSGKGKIILCSDGLYRYLTDNDMLEYSRDDDCVDKMILRANSLGGADNITAIVVEYEVGEING